MFLNIVKDQSNSFFKKHTIFSSAQYGFCKSKSKVMAVETVVSKITNIFGNKSSTSLQLINCSNAFDCVSFDL